MHKTIRLQTSQEHHYDYTLREKHVSFDMATDHVLTFIHINLFKYFLYTILQYIVVYSTVTLYSKWTKKGGVCGVQFGFEN